MKTMIGGAIFFIAVVAGTGQTATSAETIKITSPAFSAGGSIPKKYTCDGPNVSPPLQIDGLPKAAKSLVLIVDDPDAPGHTWVHWLVWNIGPNTKEISENNISRSGVQGTTDFGDAKYGGPCPPSGTHRYYFKVSALDTTLSLPSTSKKGALEKAMQGHILAKGSLMGTYSHQ